MAYSRHMEITVPANTMIIKEGELNMDMYKIIKGHVEIYIGHGTEQETLIGMFSKGKYIGELGLLAEKPAIYTAITYDEVRLIRITMASIEGYIKNNSGDVLAILQGMAEATYNLKYSMDMLVEDISKGNVQKYEENGYDGFMAKQFVKDNCNVVKKAGNFYFMK